MFIVRWILSHPIVAIWSLFVFIIILNFGGFSKSDEVGVGHEVTHEVANTENTHQVAPVDHALNASAVIGSDANTEVVTAAPAEGEATGTDSHVTTSDSDKAIITEKISDEQSNTQSDSVKSTPEIVENAVEDSGNTASEVVAVAVDTLNNVQQSTNQVVETLQAPALMQAEKAVAEVTRPHQVAPVDHALNTSAVVSSNDADTEVVTTSAKSEAVTANINIAEKISDEKPEVIEVGEQANTVVTEVPTQPKASLDVDANNLLDQARVAFWQNDFDKSAKIYQGLVENNPKNINYKGELANVLWHMKKPKESAKLYADIAVPMIQAGRQAEVGNMLGFIGAYYPEKAQEIHMLMTTVK